MKKLLQRDRLRLFRAVHLAGAGVLGICALLIAASPSYSQGQPDARWELVAPGIEHTKLNRGSKSDKEPAGPLVINMLRIDLSKARLQMVHAMDAAVGLETVSSISTRYGALAAVNSAYFRTAGVYRGDSVGLGMLNGRLLSEPNNNRAAVGLIERNGRQELVFGRVKLEARLFAGGQRKRDINGLNRQRGENELIIFTSEFHRTTLTNPDGVEFTVRNGRITARRDAKGSSTIPADGFVVSASGSARDWALKNLREGGQLRLELKLLPIELAQTLQWRQAQWRQATSIVGGGPQLIKDGRVEITNEAEKIVPAFVKDLHPRTAIAKLKSGQVLLITVDGRQPGESVGMSLTSLADLLIEFGAVEAINLDGGGSTTMVVRNKLVNKPSDTSGERPVSDAILVLPR